MIIIPWIVDMMPAHHTSHDRSCPLSISIFNNVEQSGDWFYGLDQEMRGDFLFSQRDKRCLQTRVCEYFIITE